MKLFSQMLRLEKKCNTTLGQKIKGLRTEKDSPKAKKHKNNPIFYHLHGYLHYIH